MEDSYKTPKAGFVISAIKYKQADSYISNKSPLGEECFYCIVQFKGLMKTAVGISVIETAKEASKILQEMIEKSRPPL